MALNPEKQQLIQLIGNDKVEDALKLLSSRVSEAETIITLTQLSQRYHRIKETIRNTTSSDDNIRVELSKISNSLIALVVELADEEIAPTPIASNNSVTSREVKDDNNIKLIDGKIPIFFSHNTPFNQEQQAYEDVLEQHLSQFGIILTAADFGEKKPMMHIRDQMHKVAGCVVLALERTYVPEANSKRGSKKEQVMREFILPSMWTHLEAGMAYQLGIPILIIKHCNIPSDAIFDANAHELNVATIEGGNPEEMTDNYVINQWANFMQKKYLSKG